MAFSRWRHLDRSMFCKGMGRDSRFWILAQAEALSALYPISSEEKLWLDDGVLARKKELGF
jgi:putative DNA methylase